MKHTLLIVAFLVGVTGSSFPMDTPQSGDTQSPIVKKNGTTEKQWILTHLWLSRKIKALDELTVKKNPFDPTIEIQEVKSGKPVATLQCITRHGKNGPPMINLGVMDRWGFYTANSDTKFLYIEILQDPIFSLHFGKEKRMAIGYNKYAAPSFRLESKGTLKMKGILPLNHEIGIPEEVQSIEEEEEE